MPSTVRTCPLHCGTCIEDLNRKSEVNLENKTPELVCKNLAKLLAEGIKYKCKGDDEMVYIVHMRWLNCIRWLRKTREFIKNKDLLKPYVSGSLVKDVLDLLEEISTKLNQRYQAKKLEESTKRIVDTVEKMQIEPEHNDDDLLDEIGDVPLNLPDTPTDHPETTITCMETFQEMRKLNDRIIIIDIRGRDDFQDSHIKSNRCINVPASLIKKGKLAFEIFESLQGDERTRQIIHHRARQYCDLIVMLDWQTTEVSLKQDNRLNDLKNILTDWDPGVAYQKIVVLDGGYSEWLTCFPTVTTNPSVAPPDVEGNNIAEILEDVQYPDLIQSDEDRPTARAKLKPVPERRLKPATNDKKDSIIIKSNSLGGRKVMGSKSSYDANKVNNYSDNWVGPANARADIVDDTIIDGRKSSVLSDNGPENLNVNDSKLSDNNKIRSSIIRLTADDIARPVIDRSSKPNPGNSYDTDSEKMLGLLKQKNEVTKSRVKLENAKLLLESQLFGTEDSEDSNSEQRAEALERIEVLNATIMERTKLYLDIKEKLRECEQNSINVDPAHNEEKVQLELDIGLAEHEARSVAIRRRKFLSECDKKLEEDLEMKQKGMTTPPHGTEEETKKTPLKPDGPSMNSTLKRSYSSPNLAQSESHKESASRGLDNKVPQVDRTSKPLQQQHQHKNNITNGTFVNRQPLRRDREQRMSPVFGNMHPGITGLKNLGNSCYMNSIIQCLSNTTCLARYFIQGFYTDDLNIKNKKTEGQVVEEVAQVIKALWCGHYRSISPRDLKVVIGQYKLQFESYEQQDSHEFLTFLLDWMHNDLKTKAKLESERLISNADKEWGKAMGGQASIISQLFFGQLRSTISCATCGNSSTTYESFNSLTLSLPDANRCTLDDCIRKYVSGQRVSGWRCPNCKAARDATKKFDFVKLAPIIVVHLNRFGESGGWIQKTNTAVDFPLASLDLRSYVAHDSGTTTTTTNSYHQTYNLYAVSNHYGTMEGGHYTAYCNSASQNKWYKYDDHTVREVSPNEVKSQTASAYLLFYTNVPNAPYMVM